MLSERQGYAFIHIAEATPRHMDTADEAEMLFVHAESRDGFSIAYCSSVVMQEDRRMLLDPVALDGARLGGSFSGIFDGIQG